MYIYKRNNCFQKENFTFNKIDCIIKKKTFHQWTGKMWLGPHIWNFLFCCLSKNSEMTGHETQEGNKGHYSRIVCAALTSRRSAWHTLEQIRRHSQPPHTSNRSPSVILLKDWRVGNNTTRHYTDNEWRNTNETSHRTQDISHLTSEWIWTLFMFMKFTPCNWIQMLMTIVSTITSIIDTNWTNEGMFCIRLNCVMWLMDVIYVNHRFK